MFTADSTIRFALVLLALALIIVLLVTAAELALAGPLALLAGMLSVWLTRPPGFRSTTSYLDRLRPRSPPVTPSA